MIANVDVNKLIDLLIKYKTQVSYLIAFVMCLLCFAGGRLTAQCPPKSVVCEAEDEINKGLKAELSQKDTKRIEMLREQKDADRKSCNEKVEQAKLEMSAANQFLQCSDICALYQQCEDQGRCR